MHVEFVVATVCLRKWQVETVRRIAADGHAVSFVSGGAPDRAPALALVEAFETRLYHLGPDRPLAPADPGALPTASPGPADLVIDLCGTGLSGDGLALSIDGHAPEVGAVSAIVSGRLPRVELVAVCSGERHVAGRWLVGVEEPDIIGRGIANVFGRIVDMLVTAVAHLAVGARLESLALPSVGPTEGTPPLAAPFGHVAASFVRRLRRHLPWLALDEPVWMTAWRPDAGRDGVLPDVGGAPFTVLADDGKRFYADPFLGRRDGRSFLFVEDFPFSTGRGVISAVEMTASGPAGRPEPVLETGCHLSYPFLIETGGELYMVPETSNRRTVELWHCERFPDRWRLLDTLIDGIDVSDATIFERDGRWFLFGNERPLWCSSWDGLSIWSAERLAGPWTRVGIGSVKVDAGTARPAGRIIEAGERLIRPFQDSVGGYGAGIGFSAIDRLDDGGFSETVLANVRPGAPLRGIHTYNRGFGFEVVDLFASRKVAAAPVRF